MFIQILFLIMLIISSIRSVIYLRIYLKLKRLGAKTDAHVVAIEASNFIMARYATIPKVNFITHDNQEITGKPVYSWFVEVNGYLPNKYCVAYYDEKHPTTFVVKSNGELVANFAIIAVTIIATIWFMQTQLTWQ